MRSEDRAKVGLLMLVVTASAGSDGGVSADAEVAVASSRFSPHRIGRRALAYFRNGRCKPHQMRLNKGGFLYLTE